MLLCSLHASSLPPGSPLSILSVTPPAGASQRAVSITVNGTGIRPQASVTIGTQSWSACEDPSPSPPLLCLSFKRANHHFTNGPAHKYSLKRTPDQHSGVASTLGIAPACLTVYCCLAMRVRCLPACLLHCTVRLYYTLVVLPISRAPRPHCPPRHKEHESRGGVDEGTQILCLLRIESGPEQASLTGSGGGHVLGVGSFGSNLTALRLRAQNPNTSSRPVHTARR